MSAYPGKVAARHGERGAILLVVLIVSVTVSLLAMALVSTAEVALRADANADELDRAERGARSGVEWAAARAKQSGPLTTFAGSTTLATGVLVRAQVNLLGSPRLIGRGTCQGVVVEVTADTQEVEPTRPYAFMSFKDTNQPTRPLAIDGMAYLGEPNTPLKASSVLEMTNDLDLVTTTALTAGQDVRTGGVINYGVASIAVPAWNTMPYSVAGNWTVPYRTVSGNTTLTDQTITGILVANLGGGQKLKLDNVVLNGTIIVPLLYPPLLEILGTPTLELKDTTITGGTAETGNLAILAPGCLLTQTGAKATSVSGVVYVREMDGLGKFTASGKVLVRKAILDAGADVAFHRAATFVPDVPVGIDWGGNRIMIRWIGRR